MRAVVTRVKSASVIIDEKINTFIMMLEKYGKVVKMSEFNDYFNNYK